MPQLSKIRIVNFQYNDGKRLIADELYDLERENKGPADVLINLANGGGKSVLVQLIMQPVIPKAKVAGRRIESFFTRSTDHCFVVLEWALDNSKMKLMTGIAMSASDAGSDSQDTERGFQVKYYTFISHYQNYQGSYNIISLPLSQREGGKYIPAAFDSVRNLAKKSGGGLERFSSDDSSMWKARLAEFGIMYDEWKMIEALNSNEDGLSKFFGELKTSDSVIDKLIIPRIEGKQSHGAAKEDSSLETMLISYARQFSRQKEIIQEREICSGFLAMLEEAIIQAEALWKGNDALEQCVVRLFAYSDAIEGEINRQRAEAERLDGEKAWLNNEISHIRWEKASADYYTCKKAFEEAEAHYRQAEAAMAESKEQLEAANHRLLLLECAHFYGQLREIEARISAIRDEIARRENDTASGQKLAVLKYSAYAAIQAELKRIAPELDEIRAEKAESESVLASLEQERKRLQTELEKATADVAGTEAVLNRLQADNDQLAESLHLDGVRMLDGRYQQEDLSEWQAKRAEERRKIEAEILAAQEATLQLETRIERIPQEIADVNSVIRDLYNSSRSWNEQITEYRNTEETLRALYEKYSLTFALRFTDHGKQYMAEQILHTEASIRDDTCKLEAVEEAIDAIGRGTLHIPKTILEFLDSTGLRYLSVEQYLLEQQRKGLLSKEQSAGLLSKYPFAAYGIITENANLRLLQEEAEETWLPSVLPVFTNTELDEMLRGEAQGSSWIAAFSRDYFLDRDAYLAKIREKQAVLTDHRNRLDSRLQEYREALSDIEAFSVYDESWLTSAEEALAKTKQEIFDKQSTITALQEELVQTKQQVAVLRTNEAKLKENLFDLRETIKSFDALLVKLKEEAALSGELERKRTVQREIHEKKRNTELRSAQQQERDRWLSDKLHELKHLVDEMNQGLEDVSGAAECEPVSGEWSALLEQYKALRNAQNADLVRLHEDDERLRAERTEKQREIRKRDCAQAEFEALVWSEDRETIASAEKRTAEESNKAAIESAMKASASFGAAESSYQIAGNNLSEFGGEPLLPGEVGAAFDQRIATARNRLQGAEASIKQVSEVIQDLHKASVKAENMAEQYVRPSTVKAIALAEDYHGQLQSISKELRHWKAEVASCERIVNDHIKKMRDQYGDKSADVKLAVSNMLELLSNSRMRGDRYFTLCEHISANIHTTELRINKIDTDLEEFHKTKGDLVRQCVIQGQQMYEGLMQISSNSKVNVQNKRRPMLRFDIPDAVDENVAQAAITAELEKGTEEIVEIMAQDTCSESELRRIASRTVGSKRLLRKYIGSENITLKAYKIDRNPDNSGYRTWEQTQVNNSGAEKFVVYFAVILALMAYTRDQYDGIGSQENRSVLVLDNPFGPISSKHVLEPMFEISRNYHVQMICLSDISKSDILSCFDIVIRAVVKRFMLSSKEQLTHEENETIEHGFYRAEQMDLF